MTILTCWWRQRKVTDTSHLWAPRMAGDINPRSAVGFVGCILAEERTRPPARHCRHPQRAAPSRSHPDHKTATAITREVSRLIKFHISLTERQMDFISNLRKCHYRFKSTSAICRNQVTASNTCTRWSELSLAIQLRLQMRSDWI